MEDKIYQFLNLASRMYYSGDPIIEDVVFDRLAESVGYNKLGTDTHATNTMLHAYPMFSLQKYYEGESKPIPLPNGTKDTSPKIDGAAVSHLYLDGIHAASLTRGDGLEGQSVYDKFRDTNLIPHSIPTEHKLVQITGELAAPINIPNARNYASGALNLKSVKEFKERTLEFFAYGVHPYQSKSFREDMKLLSSWGFNTVKDDGIHNIYPCDGVVIRLDDYELFDSLGYTAKHPRGAYAVKERGASVETRLLDVIWQTGKTGKVTPVAILEPVMIGDALVSRATLNNIAFIRALDIKIGDTVGVIRSGEIIPCITHKVP
jgi:DNA ligase (NAD+)